jgi:hypothetical protein
MLFLPDADYETDPWGSSTASDSPSSDPAPDLKPTDTPCTSLRPSNGLGARLRTLLDSIRGCMLRGDRRSQAKAGSLRAKITVNLIGGPRSSSLQGASKTPW